VKNIAAARVWLPHGPRDRRVRGRVGFSPASCVSPEPARFFAAVLAHSMAAADDTLLVSGVGGGVNRVMLAVVEDGGLAASVTVSAAIQ